MPMIKRSTNRFKIFFQQLHFNLSYCFKAKGTASPIMNKKEGKTQSAVVRPSQSVSLNGHITALKSPIESTHIIPTIVSPLNTSKQISLALAGGDGLEMSLYSSS
jgi:hypothetical protein